MGTDYTAAWEATQAHTAANKQSWEKGKHMHCVLAGTTDCDTSGEPTVLPATLDAGASASACTAAPTPNPTPNPTPHPTAHPTAHPTELSPYGNPHVCDHTHLCCSTMGANCVSGCY